MSLCVCLYIAFSLMRTRVTMWIHSHKRGHSHIFQGSDHGHLVSYHSAYLVPSDCYWSMFPVPFCVFPVHLFVNLTPSPFFFLPRIQFTMSYALGGAGWRESREMGCGREMRQSREIICAVRCQDPTPQRPWRTQLSRRD